MKIHVFVLAILLLLISPVFAAGNMSVTATSLAPIYANTNTSITALNLTFNVIQAGGNVVNITAINITINATAGNVSFAELRNATGATLGINSTVLTSTSFFVSITGGFAVTNTANRSMIVILNISRYATRQLNISVNISTAGIFTDDTADNMTFNSSSGVISNSSVSHGVQIQDLHANVSVSPRFVDTSAINQSFVYTIVPTGTDSIKSVLIWIPSNFTNINITSVTIDGSNMTAHTNTTIGNMINITPNTPTSNRIEVYFTSNTSATPVASSLFNSSIYGALSSSGLANLSNITIDTTTVDAANVTTKQMLNVSDITITKGTAIVNGTDYWEFTFTLNYTTTTSTSGLIQFKMTNWANNANQTLSITSATGATAICGVTNCATLRSESSFNTTNKFNVTNDYESFTKGLNASSVVQNSTIAVILRMVIPSGTPISSTWQTTYGILFRSSP